MSGAACVTVALLVSIGQDLLQLIGLRALPGG
jgi:hypothetical protein